MVGQDISDRVLILDRTEYADEQTYVLNSGSSLTMQTDKTWDVNTEGKISLTSNNAGLAVEADGTIDIGVVANTGAINIGTGGVRAIQMGSGDITTFNIDSTAFNAATDTGVMALDSGGALNTTSGGATFLQSSTSFNATADSGILSLNASAGLNTTSGGATFLQSATSFNATADSGTLSLDASGGLNTTSGGATFLQSSTSFNATADSGDLSLDASGGLNTTSATAFLHATNTFNATSLGTTDLYSNSKLNLIGDSGILIATANVSSDITMRSRNAILIEADGAATTIKGNTGAGDSIILNTQDIATSHIHLIVGGSSDIKRTITNGNIIDNFGTGIWNSTSTTGDAALHSGDNFCISAEDDICLTAKESANMTGGTALGIWSDADTHIGSAGTTFIDADTGFVVNSTTTTVNDLVVNGTLVTAGDSVTFNVASVNIKDNVLVVNATPFSSHDAGYMIARHPLRWGTTSNSAAFVTTAHANEGETHLVLGDGGDTIGTQDNQYIGMHLLITDNQGLGTTRTVSGFTGANGAAEFLDPLENYILSGSVVQMYGSTSFARVAASTITANTITTSTTAPVISADSDVVIYIADGAGAGQVRSVASLSGDTYTIWEDWKTTPSIGDRMVIYERPDRYVGLFWDEDPSQQVGGTGTQRFYMSKTHRDLTALGNAASNANANLDIDDVVNLRVGAVESGTNSTGMVDVSTFYGGVDVNNRNTGYGRSLMKFTQSDIDQPMFDFTVSSNTVADTLGSTLHVDGNGVGPTNILRGWLQINVTDTNANLPTQDYYMPFYNLYV